MPAARAALPGQGVLHLPQLGRFSALWCASCRRAGAPRHASASSTASISHRLSSRSGWRKSTAALPRPGRRSPRRGIAAWGCQPVERPTAPSPAPRGSRAFGATPPRRERRAPSPSPACASAMARQECQVGGSSISSTRALNSRERQEKRPLQCRRRSISNSGVFTARPNCSRSCHTSVVTPWRTVLDICGTRRMVVSGELCRSMKPGVTKRRWQLRRPGSAERSPMATIVALNADVSSKRAAPCHPPCHRQNLHQCCSPFCQEGYHCRPHTRHGDQPAPGTAIPRCCQRQDQATSVEERRHSVAPLHGLARVGEEGAGLGGRQRLRNRKDQVMKRFSFMLLLAAAGIAISDGGDLRH